MCFLNTCRTKYYCVTICFILLSAGSYAQQYDPFNGNAKAFHVNLSRYFKTPAEELSSRKLLLDSVKVFENDKKWNTSNLYFHLNRYEELLTSLKKHYEYYRLASYINNKDTSARSGLNQINNNINTIDAKMTKELLRPELNSLTSQQLKQLGLTKYAYLIGQTKQDAVHNLNSHDEQLADKLSGNMLDHLTDRYDNLMDSISAEIITENKKLNPAPNQVKNSKSNAAAREASNKVYYQVLNQHAEVLAATLIDITLEKTALAKLRGFNSAPERVYARKLQLPEASVKEMLQEMTNHAEELKAYQRLQAQQVSSITGLSQINSWDLILPMGFTWQPKSYAETQKLILTALSPLEKEYQNDFAWLLNPENGALEIAGGPNRVTENTSIGFPGTPTSLYMKSYGGTLKDVLRLSHEGGHAIHAQLMSDNHIVPSNSSGPNFLFEAFAMLNELLMLDELQKQATTTQAKAYFTKQFLDKLSLEVFTSAQEGAFEQGLYDGVATGKMNTREDVDTLYAGIMNKYDIFFANESERRSEWINKRLLFDDPLYNVNYLYAILVSCKLYTLLHNDPKEFAVKYTALLKNGFDAPAEEMLKRFMGFGLDNEALLNSTLQIMRDKTVKLSALYKQIN